MSDLGDRIRDAMGDLAQRARPASPMLERLDRHAPVVRRRRRLVAAATAVVLAVVSGAVLVLLQQERDGLAEPAQQPPKVFRLSTTIDANPGPALMAVALSKQTIEAANLVHLLSVDRRLPVALPEVAPGPYALPVLLDRLSADGTMLVRQNPVAAPWIELVDLATGRRTGLGDEYDQFPELSPDKSTVAVYGDTGMRLIDTVTGVDRALPMVGPSPVAGGVGWSPDGSTLAVHDAQGTVVLDLDGEVRVRAPGTTLVNGSMSWSRDGRAFLAYDDRRGAFTLVPVDGSESRVLRAPLGGLRPVGWAGSRIVWLVGQPGAQRLVSTDDKGGSAREWMRFDVGNRPVEQVTWSQALSG